MSSSSSARSSVFLVDIVSSIIGPVIIAVGIWSSPIMFFSRTSAGDIRSAFAATSIIRSRAQVSFAHGPRYAMYLPLFVATMRVRISNASQRYDPGNITFIIRVADGAPTGNPG